MDAGCENSHEKKLKIIDKMNPESEGTEPTTKINCIVDVQLLVVLLVIVNY